MSMDSKPVGADQKPPVVTQPIAPQDGQPVEQAAPTRNLIDRFAVFVVNTARNPVKEGEEHNERGVIKKTLYGLATVVTFVVALLIPVLGWVFINYAVKEHNKQVVDEKAARDKVPGLQARVTQLEAEKTKVIEDARESANNARKEGFEAGKKAGDTVGVQRTKTGLADINAKFRAEVERIAVLEKGKGKELQALLAKPEYQIKA